MDTIFVLFAYAQENWALFAGGGATLAGILGCILTYFQIKEAQDRHRDRNRSAIAPTQPPPAPSPPAVEDVSEIYIPTPEEVRKFGVPAPQPQDTTELRDRAEWKKRRRALAALGAVAFIGVGVSTATVIVNGPPQSFAAFADGWRNRYMNPWKPNPSPDPDIVVPPPPVPPSGPAASQRRSFIPRASQFLRDFTGRQFGSYCEQRHPADFASVCIDAMERYWPDGRQVWIGPPRGGSTLNSINYELITQSEKPGVMERYLVVFTGLNVQTLAVKLCPGIKEEDCKEF